MSISNIFNTVPSSKKLMKAVKAGKLETIKKYLGRGADANAADPDGSTALILAAYGNKPEIVQVLLDHGADLEKKNKYGTTARMYAKMNQYTDVLKALDKATVAKPVPNTAKPKKNTP